MDGPTFRKLTTEKRLEEVKRSGEHLGSRAHGGHRVHLYRMDGFFCEVWIRLGLQYVEWVEVASNTDILAEYVHLDPNDLLRDHE